MTAPLKLDTISMQEKFTIMEELWENMSQEAENNGFTPQWHLDLLVKRENKVKDSKENFSNLEEAKQRLYKLA